MSRDWLRSMYQTEDFLACLVETDTKKTNNVACCGGVFLLDYDFVKA